MDEAIFGSMELDHVVASEEQTGVKEAPGPQPAPLNPGAAVEPAPTPAPETALSEEKHDALREKLRAVFVDREATPSGGDDAPRRDEGNVILDEPDDEDWEPTPSEIEEYAVWLGMDKDTDKDLFHIAKEGMKAPVVPPWKRCKTPKGDVLYFNFSTGESMWDHPYDELFRTRFKKAKASRDWFTPGDQSQHLGNNSWAAFKPGISLNQGTEVLEIETAA